MDQIRGDDVGHVYLFIKMPGPKILIYFYVLTSQLLFEIDTYGKTSECVTAFLNTHMRTVERCTSQTGIRLNSATLVSYPMLISVQRFTVTALKPQLCKDMMPPEGMEYDRILKSVNYLN